MPDPSASVAELWRDEFLARAEDSQARESLREAALAARLGPWTSTLTGVVVESCRRMGWTAAAKGFRTERLPQARHEYLGMDVTAFEPAREGATPWAFPAAVFELENSTSDERVAYSLWKVACIRSPLGIVFAYRRDWDAATALVRWLSERTLPEVSSSGQTLVLAIGSRDKGESFPWGFFRFWQFTPTMRGFTKF